MMQRGTKGITGTSRIRNSFVTSLGDGEVEVDVDVGGVEVDVDIEVEVDVGEVEVGVGGWAAVLPRVQLGASLPSLPSIPSLLEPGQDMGSSRQEGERGQQSTWPHKPACLFCHSPAQAVHCIAAYAAAYIFYLLSTLSVCGLFQTGQWPQDQEQHPLDKTRT